MYTGIAAWQVNDFHSQAPEYLYCPTHPLTQRAVDSLYQYNAQVHCGKQDVPQRAVDSLYHRYTVVNKISLNMP